MQNPSEFVDAYLAAAVDPDRERYVAMFSDAVVVHDDGKTYRGQSEVRQWRTDVPQVRYDVQEVVGGPDATSCQAVVEVSGSFPGSPVTLRFRFRRDPEGRIDRLDIEP